MSPLSPFSVPEPWDDVASGYALDAALVMAPFSARALELAPLNAESDVLDVAAGPGTLALQAAARVRSVTAVDFSETMLDELQRAARDVPNLRALRADGQALPFEDAAFDAAFSMFGLMFFPDRSKGFSEMRRVLRPGSVAVVSSWAPAAESPLMRIMFGALRAADPSLPEPVADPLSLDNPERFMAEMQEAGFAEVRVEPHSVDITFEDAETFWLKLTRSSAPLVMMKKRVGPEQWEHQSTLARAYLERELPGSGPHTLSTTALLAVGRKA